jgi:hypothetical protein
MEDWDGSIDRHRRGSEVFEHVGVVEAVGIAEEG